MRSRIEEEQVEARLNDGGAPSPEFAPHIVERQQAVRSRNGVGLRVRRFFADGRDVLLFWGLVFLLLFGAGVTYLVLENLGWFRL